MHKMIQPDHPVFFEFDLWHTAADFPGTVIWLTNGLKLRDKFSLLCKKVFEANGYRRVQLPFIIPSWIYEAQPEHFSGLRPYTFSVIDSSAEHRQCGYLRTTSETAFTHLFRNMWSMLSLPLLFFQDVTVFRNESTKILPPIRAREISPFIESYTALDPAEDPRGRIQIEVEIYRTILDSLHIPYLVSRRPAYDTFPEARYTIAFDALLPDGTVSQVATVHDLGTAFAKAFNWVIDDSFPYQTSTGISGRALAVALITHYNNGTFVLPPDLMPEGYFPKSKFCTSKDALDSRATAIINSRLSYKISSARFFDSIGALLSFPLVNDEKALEGICSFFPPGYACLGYAYPLRKTWDRCVLTGRQPAFLCYAGLPL